MDKNYSKIKYGLVVFGILCLTYNLWEFFTAKYSTKQGVTFVIECLLGIGLIFLPDLVNKFLKIIMPPTIVYFYWFFLFISVFLGTSLHMISIISFWDKILHFVSPMLLTAVGYGIAAFLLKKTKYATKSSIATMRNICWLPSVLPHVFVRKLWRSHVPKVSNSACCVRSRCGRYRKKPLPIMSKR